tara:strand:+ start:62 stop:673 length:612 start_codon:yes stop_codon:yes gene_type:complete
MTVNLINLPRREKAAAKVGPRLEISPLELKAQLKNQHGLSSLLTAKDAESWEPFAWKGNDLSAPLRALWVAEARGLLQRRNDRASDIAVADIAADINAYLMQFGKKPVSENSVLTNLRTASLYLQAALGVALVPDRKTMTVRFIDGYETAENIERYFHEIKAKLQKLGSQVKHADACGYDVSHVLQAAEDATGVKLLAASNEA